MKAKDIIIIALVALELFTISICGSLKSQLEQMTQFRDDWKIMAWDVQLKAEKFERTILRK